MRARPPVGEQVLTFITERDPRGYDGRGERARAGIYIGRHTHTYTQHRFGWCPWLVIGMPCPTQLWDSSRGRIWQAATGFRVGRPPRGSAGMASMRDFGKEKASSTSDDRDWTWGGRGGEGNGKGQYCTSEALSGARTDDNHRTLRPSAFAIEHLATRTPYSLTRREFYFTRATWARFR